MNTVSSYSNWSEVQLTLHRFFCISYSGLSLCLFQIFWWCIGYFTLYVHGCVCLSQWIGEQRVVVDAGVSVPRFLIHVERPVDRMDSAQSYSGSFGSRLLDLHKPNLARAFSLCTTCMYRDLTVRHRWPLCFPYPSFRRIYFMHII